jgi:hypothetical protein
VSDGFGELPGNVAMVTIRMLGDGFVCDAKNTSFEAKLKISSSWLAELAPLYPH